MKAITVLFGRRNGDLREAAGVTQALYRMSTVYLEYQASHLAILS